VREHRDSIPKGAGPAGQPSHRLTVAMLARACPEAVMAVCMPKRRKSARPAPDDSAGAYQAIDTKNMETEPTAAEAESAAEATAPTEATPEGRVAAAGAEALGDETEGAPAAKGEDAYQAIDTKNMELEPAGKKKLVAGEDFAVSVSECRQGDGAHAQERPGIVRPCGRLYGSEPNRAQSDQEIR
jgi:hypothetical protein